MLIEQMDGGTLVLTMNQPARRNALAMEMRERMLAAFDRIEADASVRAVVINGAGGHFCAGGDISGMDATEFSAGRTRFRMTHRLVRAIIESSKPVVAAVAKSAPVIRLQTALTQLDLYHGPINGVLDGPTHQALSQLLSMVPAQVRAQYGLRSAALAEAAARHEFPLKQK